MKRSEVNKIIKNAKAMFDKFCFHLPEWADWTPEDWAEKGHECDEIRENSLGWDITDFGSGDFEKVGLTLVTIRNGNVSKGGKTYCEKIMAVGVGQKTPAHFHWFKTEDFINRGGGTFCQQMWKADEKTEEKLDVPFTVKVDGVERTLQPGEVLRLRPGQSVTNEPYVYHEFWAEGEPCMVGEVSKVNDDAKDNRFYDPIGRFPAIEEDEKPFRLLCNEYPTVK